jgi:membrane peptidoglycan carboxypeptidase
MVCHPSSLSEIDMRLASTKTAAALCGGLLLALSVPASAAVDAKLLDMLKANGQITASQYTELQAELAKDQKKSRSHSKLNKRPTSRSRPPRKSQRTEHLRPETGLGRQDPVQG